MVQINPNVSNPLFQTCKYEAKVVKNAFIIAFFIFFIG
jgi:hypothetical protein